MSDEKRKPGVGKQWHQEVADKDAILALVTKRGDAFPTADGKQYIIDGAGGVNGAGPQLLEVLSQAQVEALIEARGPEAFKDFDSDAATLEQMVTDANANDTTLDTLDNDEMLEIQDDSHGMDDTGTIEDTFLIQSGGNAATLNPVNLSSPRTIDLEIMRKFMRPTLPKNTGPVADGALNPSTINFLPTMTSNTAPAPNVTSTLNISPFAFEAFDKILTGSGNAAVFNPLPDELIIDLGDGFGVASNKYRIFSRDTSSNRFFPRAWTYRVSNNGVSYIIVDTQSDIDDPGQGTPSNYFTFKNSEIFRFHKLVITEANGNINNSSIMEWEIVESQPPPVERGLFLHTSSAEPAMGDTANSRLLSLLDGAVLT